MTKLHDPTETEPLPVWEDPAIRRRVRLAIASLGLLLALAAPFAYRLGLSASQGFSPGKAVLAILGAILLLVGLLGHRIARAYVGTAILMVNILVLLALVEVVLLALARLGDFQPAETPIQMHRNTQYADRGREDLPYFQQQDWARDFWREYHQVWGGQGRDYQPYVIWRSEAFAGRTLNVDDHGRRVTPGAECGPDAFTVFTLGGSTMWGTGVPDWGTIPAFLQTDFAQRLDRPVCVVNLSEQAYVSTQAVIQLVLELRAGRVPDLLISYDGINDVFAAYQSGVAGDPQNLATIEARFENRPEQSPVLTLALKLRSFRLARKLLERSTGGAGGARTPSPDVEPSAETIAAAYLGNVRTLEALAAQYGFSSVFFWQPLLLIDRKPLTAEEAGVKSIAAGVYPGLVELYAETYRRMRKEATARPGLHDLTDIFAGERELIYIDPWHVTLEGNERIAREMIRRVPLP